MKNQFEDDYKIYTDLNAKFRESLKGPINYMKNIESEYNAWYRKADARDSYYMKVFWLYCQARKFGNIFIDIEDNICNRDIAKGMVSVMKRFGIEYFTFSSYRSGAIESAWIFQQEGCTVEKLVEINGRLGDFGDEIKKTPAYLFKIN